MHPNRKSISVTGAFYDKLKTAAKERDTSIAAIVEAAVAPELDAGPVPESSPTPSVQRRRKSP